MSTRSEAYEPSIGRIPVFASSPIVHGGRWPAKAFVGEVIPLEAIAFREGHDLIGVQAVVTTPGGSIRRSPMALSAPGFDRWSALVQTTHEGMYSVTFEAFADEYATWLHDAAIKIPAAIDVEIMLELGALLFARGAAESRRPKSSRARLAKLARRFADRTEAPGDLLDAASSPDLRTSLLVHPIRSMTTQSETIQILSERTRAGVGAWYEFFPRSFGAVQRKNGIWKSGTFRTAAKNLARISAMGFDVVYLPPIHPIGTTNRKGKDNSLVAGAGDPGSPWAIGGAAGGHDAIHPDLGTLADFRWFVRQATSLGLEVAIDLALQASPDHPWVHEHPEWFTTLPDGSIAFAENPPKKYQDIYPINFDLDPEGLRAEIVRVVEFWIAQGVTIFRVDNPHTKPASFWEWLIHTVNATHPEIVFLAEAFTRPEPMQTLGAVGFQQSYSYFTWRTSARELGDYLEELGHETAPLLRPNLFVNTPDILPEYLQTGEVAAFKVRAVVAALGGALWGMYSGFELFEHLARPGFEEYADNEKYEYRPRDFAGAIERGQSLEPYITMLNRVRREHPAIRQLRNITVHSAEDDRVLVFSKHLSPAFLPARFRTQPSGDTIIVVVNTDPHSVVETTVHLEPRTFGLEAGESFEVDDAVTGAHWVWGADNYVRLDSEVEPAHILVVRSRTAGSKG